MRRLWAGRVVRATVVLGSALLPCATASAWEEPAAAFARAMLDEVGAAPADCPRGLSDLGPDWGLVCGQQEMPLPDFRKRWSATARSARMKRFRVVAMTGWGYATGARERRYEVNGTPVVVRRESQGPHVVVAYLRGLTACDDEWRAAHPPMIEEGEKGLVAPVVEEKTRPKYPAEAREVRAEAAVILEAVIREDGSVGDLCVVRADNRSLGFAREAVAAVRRWRYRPAMKDGVPVELMMTIAVTFSLH